MTALRIVPPAVQSLLPSASPSAYLGEPGGPRDPSTPGGYCLARCYCGTCPQHAEQQRQHDLVRALEYEGRERKEADRAAERAHRAQERARRGKAKEARR